MTQSVRNFVLTQNPIWKERYNSTVSLLDAEITNAIIGGDSTDAAFFDNVDFANQKLIELEMSAFTLTRDGNSDNALLILEGDEYQNYKTIYSYGLENYAKRHGLSYVDAVSSASEILEDISLQTQERIDYGTNLIFALAISVILTSFILGLLVARRIVNPLNKIRLAAKQISQGKLETNIPESGYFENKELAKLFNIMSDSLQKTIELDKKLAITESQLKSERFATIGEVTSKIVHDLKNPLTAVKSELELIQHFNRENFDDKTKKRVRNMEYSLDMMNDQIEGMMNFVRVPRLSITFTIVSNLINFVVKIVLKPKNITIDLPQNDFAVQCDVKKFQTVLLNLITDSIQSIGDDKGEISIIFEDAEKHVIVSVSDSGIPLDAIDKIFDPLFTTKSTGTGLGLSRCKSIVEQHGGAITVKNDPTTFTILLPRNIDESRDTIQQTPQI